MGIVKAAIGDGVLTFYGYSVLVVLVLLLLQLPKLLEFKDQTLSLIFVMLFVFGIMAGALGGASFNPTGTAASYALGLGGAFFMSPFCAGLHLMAFGWAYVNNRHNTSEHFYVYRISPFVGAIVAAWTFRLLFPPPSKQTSA